jgi:four helix bundle protein
MTSTPVPGPAALPVPVPVTDADRLDVYRLAVTAQALLAGLLPRCTPVLRDQLERASVSFALNIAEGAGRYSRGEKRRHYSSAHGSAVESAAVLDLLVALGLVRTDECLPVRALLVRVIQMIVRLEQRMAR